MSKLAEESKQQSKLIRVSFVIGSLALGGAEIQLIRLANGLDRRCFRPSIVCLWKGGELESLVAPDVPVFKIDLPALGRRSLPSRVLLATHILPTLVRGLHSQHPDVVHAYLPVAYVLGGLAAWLLRVSVIVAGRRGLTSFEGFGYVAAQLANRVIDIHICNSEAVRDYAIAKENLGLRRLRVIHNGIDLPPLVPAAQLPKEWETEGVKAAMVANFIRYKGHREVLHAVARVVKRHPRFRMVLIGDGPEHTILLNLTRELGIADSVVFGGRRRDAGELMAGFDFTVLGSSEEGFPNALMESMARAVPVVSTAVGGVNELVQDGVHGRLVPYGDPQAMADAIIWMIEHPEERHRMGETGRRRIAAEFSTERMVRATEAVYKELLRRPAPIAAPK